MEKALDMALIDPEPEEEDYRRGKREEEKVYRIDTQWKTRSRMSVSEGNRSDYKVLQL
ncbi:hypothetical protein SAMN05518684_106215 [Salipaludibacillus aurantiacus]|uniref:Uncharacterized protein n=1 Tax=Salipaludibacillus aurantiacus TaxID=1601833 RepID=A0A1H9U0Y0_9BACI|nr:hypothetical protein SAMN05518684_106215 [Salipaludibacillus aurantiacus]